MVDHSRRMARSRMQNTSIMGRSRAQLRPNEVTEGFLDLGMPWHRRLLAIPWISRKYHVSPHDVSSNTRPLAIP